MSLEIQDKELLVLVGPSGCGKTTLLRLIAGLEEPNSGSIVIDGREVNNVPAKDRDVAMVFQSHALYPHFSAYENIAFGLKVRHWPKEETRQKVEEAAGLLSLGQCLERKPDELSGGERQRVALARALVRRPKVFLFDEPLSNLDAQMRSQMRIELSRLHRKLEATILHVTHDQVEAMALGQRIAVMNEGRIQQIASPNELYRRPANLFVASFIGTPQMNFFPGMLANRDSLAVFKMEGAEGSNTEPLLAVLDNEQVRRLTPYKGKPLILGVRPEHIFERATEETSGVRVQGTVELVEFLGAEAHVHLSAGGQSFLAKVRASTSVRAGQEIAVGFDMTEAHFFVRESGKAV